MRIAVGLLVVTGCGRVAFDLRADPALDGGDAAPPGGTCWPAWRAGVPALSTPQPATTVNSNAFENNPFLTADGLTLYFSSGRTGPTEFWYAERPTRADAFTIVGIAADLSTPLNDGTVQLSPDGNTAYLSSMTAAGDFDLAIATRSNPNATFQSSTFEVASLNTPASEFDLHPVGEGLRVYFARNNPNTDIMVAERASLDDPFGPATTVPGLDTADLDADPFVSPDELVIMFSAERMLTSRAIYMRTRSSMALPFGGEQRLDVLDNATGADLDAALSSDGCELWFVSDRDGSHDLWFSTVQL